MVKCLTARHKKSIRADLKLRLENGEGQMKEAFSKNPMKLQEMKKKARGLGKTAWHPMLEFLVTLHERSIHPPQGHMPYPWEDSGPGYCYGPAFGHWDIIHSTLDAILSEPGHARNQIVNDLAGQQPDGLVPGCIWMENGLTKFSNVYGHPPLWQVAIDELTVTEGNENLIESCFPHLLRQIGWFETKRKAEPDGFFYLDILTHDWESGVDEGIRFLDVKTGPLACVDATSHVYGLYECAARWSKALGKDPAQWEEKAKALRLFIQTRLFSEETGFFHDIWSVNDSLKRCLSFEGMWPMVVGAATTEQAMRVIDENLMNPERFLSKHPLRSVAKCDPRFEMRCWRGPAWNSMTYWAARGCVRYGRTDAAKTLLEMALDSSAEQFARTGTIWEFYHSEGGDQMDVKRKPDTQFNIPCRDYVGHNPLIAMAEIYESITKGKML